LVILWLALVSARRSFSELSCRGAGGFAVHPVLEDEEGQPEDEEGVLGSQFVVLHVDVELFGEAADRSAVTSLVAGSM
jgi:hypothetical protein